MKKVKSNYTKITTSHVIVRIKQIKNPEGYRIRSKVDMANNVQTSL